MPRGWWVSSALPPVSQLRKDTANSPWSCGKCDRYRPCCWKEHEDGPGFCRCLTDRDVECRVNAGSGVPELGKRLNRWPLHPKLTYLLVLALSYTHELVNPGAAATEHAIANDLTIVSSPIINASTYSLQILLVQGHIHGLEKSSCSPRAYDKGRKDTRRSSGGGCNDKDQCYCNPLASSE